MGRLFVFMGKSASGKDTLYGELLARHPEMLTAMLPKGETIRRIAGLAGGLILLLAVVQPLLRVRWEELTWRYETGNFS